MFFQTGKFFQSSPSLISLYFFEAPPFRFKKIWRPPPVPPQSPPCTINNERSLTVIQPIELWFNLGKSRSGTEVDFHFGLFVSFEFVMHESMLSPRGGQRGFGFFKNICSKSRHCMEQNMWSNTSKWPLFRGHYVFKCMQMAGPFYIFNNYSPNAAFFRWYS